MVGIRRPIKKQFPRAEPIRRGESTLIICSLHGYQPTVVRRLFTTIEGLIHGRAIYSNIYLSFEISA